MIKTFPHSVIWNGEIIPANTPIEIENPIEMNVTISEKETVTEETKAKPKKKGADK